jgi:quercetin dioxygenase-like cupin family protein
MHHKEVVTVLSGEGLVATDAGMKRISSGSSFVFEIGEFHAIKAVTELRYIEVLMGNVESNDIERMLFEWEEIENYVKKQ